MVILVRCNSIYSDSRTEKYISYYINNNIDYVVIGWDRLGENLKNNNTIYFKKKSGYGVGGIKAVINRILWMYFVIYTLIKYKKQIHTIHACDLDAAFPATLFKVFFKTSSKVIFDIFDWFSATLSNQKEFIKIAFRWMERFTINHSNEVIICESERIEQIPYKLKKKELILPNIPYFSDISFLKFDDTYRFGDDKIVLTYVGGFNDNRFLDELLDLAERGIVNLLIAGYGDLNLENRCSELENLSNVKYFKKVNYSIGLNIMYNADIIYAMYCKGNMNHLYAAPNKYYEAMMLGKPIISTKGISLSQKILINDIGYIIEESIDELIDLIHSIKKEDLVQKGKNANVIWNERYKNYTNDFFETQYKLLL